MDNNPEKTEFGIFFERWGVGIGFGRHFEDRRWENEVKLFVRRDEGLFSERFSIAWLKDFVIPSGYSSWKKQEIAHETFYKWGLLGLYVDIPSIKAKCRFLKQ